MSYQCLLVMINGTSALCYSNTVTVQSLQQAVCTQNVISESSAQYCE